MPPLGTFSEAEMQLLNDPTRSVKRAQLATLCRKVSLKVKGTNEQLIVALNAAAQNNITDRENIDPMATTAKNTDDPFRSKSVNLEDDQYESSFETIIYHSKENENWSQSTPATVPRGRKSSGRRKSTKQNQYTTGMYPELSLYPDISNMGGDMPTTTTEDFSKIADGILEEMNTRLTAKHQTTVAPISSPAPEPIFRDVMIPLKESPFLVNTNSKHRFSDVHNKIFTKMDSVETHYAAQREFSNSPDVRSPLRIPKRPISTVEAIEPSPKRMRSGTDMEEKSRFFEGRREESLSEQGRDIQNMMRQELQKRLLKKLGTATESDDSIELESHHMPGKTDLDSGGKLTFGKRIPNSTVKDKVIPVKSASQYSLNEMADDSPSLSDSRAAIKAPGLSAEVPSILLVPGTEPVLPKDKKIPTKHTPKQPKSGGRALVIPAAKSTKQTAIKMVNTCPAPAPASPSKMQLSPYKSAKFIMGAVPDNPVRSVRRKSQRVAAKGMIPRPSPTKPRAIRSASSTRAATQKALTIRSVPTESSEVRVPVRFDGGKGKRKYMETVESSPTKRVKLNGGSSFTPARKPAGVTHTTPSMSLVRYDAHSAMFTPGAVGSRTPSKVYGNGRSAPRRPPWR